VFPFSFFMAKTIFITGSSSGIGKATALYFARKGWNVAATMRNPDKEKELTQFSNVLLLPLDVLNQMQISEALQETIRVFGTIDVLVNNAGYAASGAFELATPEQIKKQFDVNVFGLMNMTQAVLPYFRAQKSGTIINLASVAGHCGFPGMSLYNATKFAVEGFSESLQYELNAFNIKVKVVEPGPIKTDFYSRSMDIISSKETTVYDNYINKVTAKMNAMGNKGKNPDSVVKIIFKATISKSNKLRYPVGCFERFTIFSGKILPHCLFRFIINKMFR